MSSVYTMFTTQNTSQICNEYTPNPNCDLNVANSCRNDGNSWCYNNHCQNNSGWNHNSCSCTAPCQSVCQLGPTGAAGTVYPTSYTFPQGNNYYEDTAVYSNVRVICDYNPSDFSTFEAINNFVGKYQDTTSVNTSYNKYFTEMVSNFCSLQTTDCNYDPLTGQLASVCSMMTSVGNGGSFCRNWMATGDPGSVEAAKQNYCDKYPSSPDCSCIKRSLNDVFETASGGGAISQQDYCFWAPCQLPDYYLIPESLLKPDTIPCPSSICQIAIENLINSQNNTLIQEGKILISCVNNTPGGSFWTILLQNLLFILIAAILIIAIVVGILLIAGGRD